MKTKVRKIANLALKITIVIAAVILLYEQLFNEKDIIELFRSVKEIFQTPRQLLLMGFALLLMPLNLLFEAQKWRLLINKVEHVKLSKAFLAVLVGISVGMFLPNRVGEFLGRVFILEKGSHVKGILVTIIGSFSQLICTIFAGCVALFFAFPMFREIDSQVAVWLYVGFCLLLLFVVAIVLLLYFNINLLSVIGRFLFKKKKEKIEQYIEVFSQYSKKELFMVLLFSAIRYAIFSFQFVMLIWAFNLEIGYFNALMLIALTYFFMAIIPTLTIIEPSIRGSVSIYIFEKWFSAQGLLAATTGMMVLLASTMVWIFNLAIPAFLGVFFVYRLKFFRKR